MNFIKKQDVVDRLMELPYGIPTGWTIVPTDNSNFYAIHFCFQHGDKYFKFYCQNKEELQKVEIEVQAAIDEYNKIHHDLFEQKFL